MNEKLEIRFKLTVGKTYRAGDMIECTVGTVDHIATVKDVCDICNEILVAVTGLKEDDACYYVPDLSESCYFIVPMMLEHWSIEVPTLHQKPTAK